MLECLYGHCWRLCFDLRPVTPLTRLSTHSPARSQVSSSNLSRQSTQEYVDSSIDIYEPDQPPTPVQHVTDHNHDHFDHHDHPFDHHERHDLDQRDELPHNELFPHMSPAKSRWIKAFNRVCMELSEVSCVLPYLIIYYRSVHLYVFLFVSLSDIFCFSFALYLFI